MVSLVEFHDGFLGSLDHKFHTLIHIDGFQRDMRILINAILKFLMLVTIQIVMADLLFVY